MWFKQAHCYQLQNSMPYDAKLLSEQLQAFAFAPCLPSLSSAMGFIAPLEEGSTELVHAANGYLLFCLQFEDKLLPAQVVTHALKSKVKKLEAAEARRLSQKEKRELKDEVRHELLTRAFSKLTRLNAYVDTRQGLLMLDNTIPAKTEKFVERMNRTLAQNAIEPIATQKIAPLLTDWLLTGNVPAPLSIEPNCVLFDPMMKRRIIRIQQQDPFVRGIQSLLKDGYQVQQVSLNWHEKISFTLTDSFMIKGIRYHDDVKLEAKDYHSESEQQRFDADFYIMTQTITALLKDLLPHFAIPQSSAQSRQSEPAPVG